MKGFISLGLMLAVSASAQQMAMGNLTDFTAPIIYDVSTITSPQSGLIVYDSKDNAFKGRASSSSGWLTFTPQGFSILTTTSSTKTPGGSAQYHQLTNNSITLTTGTWRLSPAVNCNNSGSPGYSACGVGLAGANGADSGSSPAALSTVSGLTTLTVTKGDLTQYAACPSNLCYLSGIPQVVQCSASTCVVYVITWSEQTTSANARITAYLNAERIN